MDQLETKKSIFNLKKLNFSANAREFIPSKLTPTLSKLQDTWQNFTKDAVLTHLFIQKEFSPEDAKYMTDDDWTKIVDAYDLDIFSVCKLKRAFHSASMDVQKQPSTEDPSETLVSGFSNARWRRDKYICQKPDMTGYKKQFHNSKHHIQDYESTVGWYRKVCYFDEVLGWVYYNSAANAWFRKKDKKELMKMQEKLENEMKDKDAKIFMKQNYFDVKKPNEE